MKLTILDKQQILQKIVDDLAIQEMALTVKLHFFEDELGKYKTKAMIDPNFPADAIKRAEHEIAKVKFGIDDTKKQIEVCKKIAQDLWQTK